MYNRKFDKETHDKPTHQSWGKILQGTFHINKHDMREFMQLYSNTINDYHLSILELPKEYGPILIDVDLKSKEAHEDRLYNDTHIRTLLNIYNNVLNEFLDVDNLDYNLCVLEKPQKTNIDDIYRDGLHIMIPEICTTIEIRHAIRNRVIQLCNEYDLFNNYSDKIDKIIDKSVISSNGWFLYGSYKPNGLPYKLSKVYDKQLLSVDLEGDLIKYFSTYYKYKRYSEKTAQTIKQSIKHDSVVSNISRTYMSENKIYNNTHNKTEEDIIKLLSCLNYDRFSYNDWLNVGIIIYNETNNIELWKNWSKQYDKYNKKELIEKWGSFNDTLDKKLTIKTLIQYAREDNLDLYNKCFYIKCIFDNVLSTASISIHFKKIHGDKFIYQKAKLYYFNGFYWISEDVKDKLININNFIRDTYFFNLMNEFQVYEMKQLKSDGDSESKCKRLNEIRAYINTLLNHDKRQKFINELICILNNDDIKFDNTPYLFAFNNKIYDLSKGDFIEPNPEQYISITCGYDFIEADEAENKSQLNIMINTIFKQPELKKIYLTTISTGLDGLPLEKFILANGSGGNGKGVLNELIQYMLGNYAYILPADILLKPLKTGNNPEIANLNKKRLVIAREPDHNLMFNCATIKELTGGSQINARLNYSNDTTTHLNMTFILECNDKPKLNEVNDALSRRILDIPFKSKFVNKEDYNKLDEEDKQQVDIINTYYKTEEFKEKYKFALFFILVEHYKEYIKNDKCLPVPEEVIKRNHNYMASSDELLNWFEDKYEKTNDPKDIIKLKDIYELFTRGDYFINLNKIQKRQMNYKNFINKMETNMFLKKYVKFNKDKVYIMTNYRIISKYEDENEEQHPLDIY